MRSRAASARSRASRAQTRSCSAGKRASQSGCVVGDLLGDDVLARREFRGAEDFEIVLDALAPGRGLRGVERGDVVLVGFRAGRENLDQRRPFRLPE